MIPTQHDPFFDVRMPRWYRVISWVSRVIGFVLLTTSVWWMGYQNPFGSVWTAVGIFGGIALLLLPSLPKAYIEQRNRLKGLLNGTFDPYRDETPKD